MIVVDANSSEFTGLSFEHRIRRVVAEQRRKNKFRCHQVQIDSQIWEDLYLSFVDQCNKGQRIDFDTPALEMFASVGYIRILPVDDLAWGYLRLLPDEEPA